MKLLKFYAEWCGPCKGLTMIINGAKDKIDIVKKEYEKIRKIYAGSLKELLNEIERIKQENENIKLHHQIELNKQQLEINKLEHSLELQKEKYENEILKRDFEIYKLKHK